MATKQVLVVRDDLNMRKGKIAAQSAHGATKVFFDRKLRDVEDIVRKALWPDGGGPPHILVIPLTEEMHEWEDGVFAKICLGVESEADLLRVYEEAKARGLPTTLITDAGRTEFHGVATNTVVAVGPAEADDIDAITGPNGLVKCKLL